MNLPRVQVGGRELALDRLIGKGGEGMVYLVAGDPTHAVKLYTTSDRLSREDKIAAMVQSELGKRSSLAAFPLAIVRSHDGTFAGFVMRLVNNHRPIHELYAPGPRKHHFPQADYRFLARATTNIAKAFASVHQTGCVVGDINHSGVLVSSKATATLIDADSFQFTLGEKQFLCKVGVPEYTPPELQGKPLRGVVRTTDHDAFGLAVVVFQMLLMGRHPFMGKARQGENPPLEECIREFRYAYAEDRDVGMDQPPGTPALSDFSAELAALFNRAFSKSSLGTRPAAQDWVAALERFEASLIQCADNPLHFGPKDASECPWCEMEQQLQAFLFLPYFGNSEGVVSKLSATPIASNFDLQLVWARIEHVRIPQIEQVRPVLSPLMLGPSSLAYIANDVKKPKKHWAGLSLLMVALVLFIVEPGTWPLAIAMAWWGFTKLKVHTPKPDARPFIDEFVLAKQQWYQEIDGWRSRIGLFSLLEERQKLAAAKDRYAALKDEERRQIQEYRTQRRDRQLHFYLEGFDVARADIKGIGHAKLAALASYGIDTAADMNYQRIMNVPGFGDALTKRLLEWRRKHESHFVFSSTENEVDRREIARIQGIVEGKAIVLRAVLSSGAQLLEGCLSRFQDLSRRPDPILAKVSERVEQARKDLEFLGIEEPQVQPRLPRRIPVSTNSAANLSRNSSPAPASTPIHAKANPNCPRCGSGMRLRLAGKGRNAGQHFWGCSRYPGCKGTRPN